MSDVTRMEAPNLRPAPANLTPRVADALIGFMDNIGMGAPRERAARPSGAALYAEYRCFLTREGLSSNEFCRDAGLNTSTISTMRHAACPSEATVRRLRAAMDAWPNVVIDGAPAPQAIEHAALPQRVDRDPCFRCGVRADLGCEHQPREAGL